ncbi:AAA family ATPase [bacterium]|nr:AAA family ATPase [bacterium]MBU1599628.1 AAA family ATPase [bacterium]MBU2461326.1 AAA family ATPase [bacterium]
MTRIIALANQKGGCGKTTTCVNLGASLAVEGYSVLIIDLDPQANATIHLGIDIHKLNRSIYDVLIQGEVNVSSIILDTPLERLKIAPSHINLSGAEIELVNTIGRERVLKEAINPIRDVYDYILIDCPPSLGLLTLNGLTTADEVIIPLQTEFFALEGMDKLLKTIQIVKEKLNHNLKITAITPTLFSKNTRLAQEALKKIATHFKDTVTTTIIRRNVKLAEAPSHGLPITLYAPSSYGAVDYKRLAHEVIKR